MSPIDRSLNPRVRTGERGVALFVVLFALLLLSTIAVAMTYTSNTESGINLNYRQEEMAYFASRAGIEELRDRMSLAAGVVGPITPPPGLPVAGTANVLYLINQGADPTTVQPWSASNAYADDELCHDGYTIGSWPTPTSVPGPGVRCTDLPSGSGWYQTVTSNIQWNGTAAAVPYKWARVAMKQNNSVMYGDPAVGNAQNYYYVDSTKGASQPACYDGTSERVPPGTTTCAGWAPTVYANPVYLITAMGVSPTGARKVVQQEVALPPSPPFPYGLLSMNPNCSSMVFSGNGFTDSYNSALGTYAATVTASGGDIGSFGNVNLGGNANIQGIVGVDSTNYNTTVGNCNNGVKGNNGVTGNGVNWKDQGLQALPAGLTPASFPTPPPPNPTPPTTNASYTSNVTLPPGTYGNISISGKMTLTLTPGVYNINSLSAAGQSNIVVNPVGQVVLNIGGAGGTAFNFAGQSITNGSNIPYDFLINYSGTDTITLDGQNASYLMLDAPNAAVNVAGKGDTFGSIIANTINYSGNGNWHYDKNSALKPQSNQNYVPLSFREISY